MKRFNTVHKHKVKPFDVGSHIVQKYDFAYDEKHNLKVVPTEKIDIDKVVKQAGVGVGIVEAYNNYRRTGDKRYLNVREGGAYLDGTKLPKTRHEADNLIKKGLQSKEKLSKFDEELAKMSGKELIEFLDDENIDKIVARKFPSKVNEEKENG